MAKRSGRAVVLGGGVAGFTAAHELLERGFTVELIERRPIAGGRARSYPVACNGHGRFVGDSERRRPGPHLPGEHGFRFFPGFYRHLFETMKRIPLSAGSTVFDNLVEIEEEVLSLSDGRRIELPASAPQSFGQLRRLLGLERELLHLGLSAEDLEVFGDSLWRIATSCADRRLTEYERIGWLDFIGARGRSPEYEWFLASGITRTLVAAQARWASARTMGNIALQLWLQMSRPGGTTDRVLNGPTNEVWFDPWLRHLQAAWPRAFRFRPGTRVVRLHTEGDQLVGASVAGGRGRGGRIGDGDTAFVCTLPPEQLLPLLERSGVTGPLRDNLDVLVRSTSPRYLATMGGLQIFLRRDHPFNPGHQILLDSPWGLSAISQAQFWPDRRRHLPPGMGVLSVDISSWDLPGRYNRRAAQDCAPEEVFQETLAQLRDALGPEGLEDSNIHGHYLDESLRFAPGRGLRENQEPILVNHCGAWALRPEPETEWRNLALAGDWVRTETDLACMEGANEAARRAVNVVLERSGHRGPPVALWSPPTLPALAPLRALDQLRFSQGLPWAGGPCGRWLAPAAGITRGLGELISGEGPAGDQRPLAGSGYRRPALPQPAQQPQAAPGGSSARGRAGKQALRPLTAVEREQCLAALPVEASGWHNNRRDRLFTRWPLQQRAGARSEARLAQYRRWLQDEHQPLPSAYLPVPFHIYDGFALIIQGRADLGAVERLLPGNQRAVVGRDLSGQRAAFAYLWIMHYRDTVVGPYNEVLVNFPVSPERRCHRCRSPQAALLPMLDPDVRLYTPFLLLDQARPIQYGNDLFGTDKRLAEIHIQADGDGHRFDVPGGLSGSVPVRESLFADLESRAKLAREAGVLQLARVNRQAVREGFQRGGLLIQDRRRGGGGGLLELQAAYRFRPRLRSWGPPCQLTPAGVQVGGPASAALAQLLRQVAFQPQMYSWDPHFMSVLHLDGWAPPVSAGAPTGEIVGEGRLAGVAGGRP